MPLWTQYERDVLDEPFSCSPLSQLAPTLARFQEAAVLVQASPLFPTPNVKDFFFGGILALESGKVSFCILNPVGYLL